MSVEEGGGKDATRKRKRGEEKGKLDSWKSDILYLSAEEFFFFLQVGGNILCGCGGSDACQCQFTVLGDWWEMS